MNAGGAVPGRLSAEVRRVTPLPPWSATGWAVHRGYPRTVARTLYAPTIMTPLSHVTVTPTRPPRLLR